jgi:hypothetical protein
LCCSARPVFRPAPTEPVGLQSPCRHGTSPKTLAVGILKQPVVFTGWAGRWAGESRIITMMAISAPNAWSPVLRDLAVSHQTSFLPGKRRQRIKRYPRSMQARLTDVIGPPGLTRALSHIL